jgi:Fungal specific transcription factor domain
MMSMRKALFSLGIHDKALFHACFSHYAATYILRFKTGDPLESLQHRNLAIKTINERLGDPEQALRDTTIATIAHVAIYEVFMAPSAMILRFCSPYCLSSQRMDR